MRERNDSVMKLTKIFALAAAAALTLTAASCGAKTKKIESIDDLAGAKIGVQLGTTGDIYISGDVEGGVFPDATVEKYNKGVRARVQMNGDKKVRVCPKCGAEL
jgi:polar amino acid transport system substrate-binding protein